MRAIILAAGMGSRLGYYTTNLPKGMLPFLGHSLIEWQINTYLRLGINDIVIVTGYNHEKISFPRITYRHNSKFDSTNMVESLMVASDLFDTELIISYADLIFEESVLQKTIESIADVGVVVDIDWKPYWQARYGLLDFDIESLNFDKAGHITHLGTPDVSADSVDGRYVGLIKLSYNGLQSLIEVYNREKNAYQGGIWRNSKSFNQGYMTDLLQAIIDLKQPIQAIKIQRGWLEFDTVEDYEKYQLWAEEKSLSKYITLSV